MSSVVSLFGYIGPETIVPITSALAVLGGVALFAWQWLCSLVRRCVQIVFRKSERTSESN